MIGIIDYGMGNLASVANALEKLGVEARLLTDSSQLSQCERAILPGVGSFARAMGNLGAGGWEVAIRDFASGGRPLLGICLGMQLLFTQGEEHGQTPGLGLIPGRVTLMRPTATALVPHVGWNSLVRARKHPLLDGVSLQADVYFVHSYACVPDNAEDVIARCDHGGLFVACTARGSVAGVQFHPEKSQPMGLRILENFAQWDGTC